MRTLVTFAISILRSALALFRSREEQVIVELALRQQLAVYAQNHQRPRLSPLDRTFWVVLSRFWPRWKNHLVVVRPETVVRWHHNGFRRYWRSISAPGPGRPPISKEVQELIIRMATENPTGRWVIQQLRETFPDEPAHRYLIYDNDSIFSTAVTRAIESFEIDPKRIAFRSPWQNGKAERFVGTVRRELLDRVVVLNEDHLRRLLREYVNYYNSERVHTSIGDAPVGRPVESRPSADARVVSLPRVKGVHHRYRWREAA